MERRWIRIKIGQTNKWDGKGIEKRRDGDKSRKGQEKRKKRVRDEDTKETIFREGLNLRMR
jgi:hypothetical protein